MSSPKQLPTLKPAIGLTAAGLVLALAACGGDNDKSDNKDNGSKDATSVPTTGTAPEKSGGPSPAKGGDKETGSGASGKGAEPDVKALKRTKTGLEPAVKAAVQKQAGGKKVAGTFCGPTDIPKNRWNCTLSVGKQQRQYTLSIEGSRFSGQGYALTQRLVSKKGKKVPTTERKRLGVLKGSISS